MLIIRTNPIQREDYGTVKQLPIYDKKNNIVKTVIQTNNGTPGWVQSST